MTLIVGQDNVEGIPQFELYQRGDIAIHPATIQADLFGGINLSFDPFHPLPEPLQNGSTGLGALLGGKSFPGLDPTLYIALLGGKESGKPLAEKTGFVIFIGFLSPLQRFFDASIDLVAGHIKGQIEVGNAIQSAPGTGSGPGGTMFNRLILKGFLEESELIFKLTVDIARIGHIYTTHIRGRLISSSKRSMINFSSGNSISISSAVSSSSSFSSKSSINSRVT